MALDRITLDPDRMRGLPCIRDARVTVSVGTALRAGDALEFGGVLVNDVPTFRADQQP
jgi:hypothetical protein